MTLPPREHAEKELACYKTIVTHLPYPVTIADPSGNVWYWNGAFTELFGRIPPASPDSLISSETDRQAILKANRDGLSWSGEVTLTGAAGYGFRLYLQAIPIRNPQEQLIGQACIYQDLTRERQAGEALEKSAYKYQALVENSPDLLYRTDLNGIITFISPSVKDLSGFEIEEAVGMKMAEEVYAVPEERQRFLQLLSSAGSVRNFQARLKRKDGSIWWASTNAHFLRDKDGAIIGVEGITRDVTEIKEAETASRKSEERLRMAGKLAYDLIYEWDVKTDALEWFGDINNFLGYTGGEITPTLQGWLDMVHPEDRERVQAAIDLQRSSRHPISYEYRIRKADGSWNIWTDKGLPLLDDDGQPAKWIGVCTDITDRKAYETQLEQAQKMESIGTLAGGIAHDFNNLLGGLFGYLNLALKKATDPKLEKFIRKALQASERAAGLTQQLLTFSKGGAPRRRVDQLDSFLRETNRFALSGSNVSCDFAIDDDLWLCSYDKNQLGQAIDNIVLNARQAMADGGKIALRAQNTTVTDEIADLDPGSYLRISITDTGAGILEENLPRIFDPFFTTKSSGSGLGLTAAYSIVKKHGGTITVSSEAGAGTTLHVLLPAAEEWNNASGKNTNGPFQGSGKILAMDDDQLMQSMLTELLEELGFSVVMTGNGRQALDAFKQARAGDEPFRAIILDLTIRGGMGGRETVAGIRELDRKIPVFVASGYSDDDAIANPEAFGFTASVRKPFGLESLIQVFRKHLS